MIKWQEILTEDELKKRLRELIFTNNLSISAKFVELAMEGFGVISQADLNNTDGVEFEEYKEEELAVSEQREHSEHSERSELEPWEN